MSQGITNRSPLHEWHEARCDDWQRAGDMLLPACYKTDNAAGPADLSLSIADVSHSPIVELKGPGARDWLSDQAWEVPDEIFDITLVSARVRILRTGGDEFLVMGYPGTLRHPWTSELPEPGYRAGILTSHREDAVVFLQGERVGKLMAQTCALNYDALPDFRVFLTRVASVSCGFYKDSGFGQPACWLWVAPSHALDLWTQLAEIVQDLGGQVVTAQHLSEEV